MSGRQRPGVGAPLAWLRAATALLILLFGAAVFPTSGSRLQPDLVAASPGQRVPVEYFLDASGQRTRAEVLELGPMAWRSLEGEALNFGFLGGTYWLRGLVRAPEQATDVHYVLQIANPHLRDVRVYLEGSDPSPLTATQAEWHLGSHLPHADRPLDTRSLSLPLRIEPGQRQTVLLRVHTEGALQVPLHLWPRREFEQRDRWRLQLDTLFLGALLGVAAVHAALSLEGGRRAHLMHAAWSCSIGLYLFALNGGAFQALWPDDPVLNQRMVPTATVLVAACAAVYTHLFLEVRAGAGWHRLLVGAIVLAGALIAALYPWLGYSLATQLAVALVMASALVNAAHTVRALHHRRTAPAWLHLLGFGAVYLAGGVQVLSKSGVLPYDPWTDLNLVQLAAMLELVASVLALALWRRQLQRQALQAPAQALAADEVAMRRMGEMTRTLTARNIELARISRTDALTGVFNRRHFDECLEAEVRRATASGQHLSVALIDIDHFKQFNDRHGHVAGDACLKAVAACIRAQLQRSSDGLCRFGGEEFALILPFTERAGAERVCERIRQAVAGVEIEVGQRMASVTISIGLLSLAPGAPCHPLDLVRRADRALYLAKRQGRNRVCAETLGA